MAKNKSKRSRNGEPESKIKKETLRSVLSIVFFVLSIFLLLAYFEKAGIAGEMFSSLLRPLLGIGYFILPLILIILGIAFILSVERNLAVGQSISAFLFFLAGLGMLELLFPGQGGKIGALITSPSVKFFDTFLTAVIFLAIIIITLLIIFDSALRFNILLRSFQALKNLFIREKVLQQKEIGAITINGKEIATETETASLKEARPANLKKPEAKKSDELAIDLSKLSLRGKAYKPPPLDLLSKDRGKPGVGDVKANANIIKRTLQNFGINVEMDEVTIGPTVTRYALKPAEGVKLSKIVGLQNDLALALAAHPIRIEAPIPGKSLVGIEIPNNVKTIVGLGDLLAEEEFQASANPLLVSLGKAISGKPQFGDLAKMPHLLIAGTTGAGKSVLVHSIITSLLYRNSPESLKFILIDPKRVELTLYNKVPHLLTPVLTDPKKVILALKWAAKEMDRRYDVLESEKVRDIASYHKNILEPKLKKIKNLEGGADLPEAMPYIIVVIDELADIMSLYPRELEAVIVRLAQMSRAVGIHLILSTQRPSVNVITGLIKANVPTRIALQVASQVDSRTILDMAGAEKLLGAGDMLFLSNELSKPQRIQSAFITESEVKNVSKYLIDNYDETETIIDLNLDTANNVIESAAFEDDGNDELYEEAEKMVKSAGKASTSYLQRKLKVGYSRAARLIDLMEKRGVVGPADGSKPREVYGSYNNPDSESEEDMETNENDD